MRWENVRLEGFVPCDRPTVALYLRKLGIPIIGPMPLSKSYFGPRWIDAVADHPLLSSCDWDQDPLHIPAEAEQLLKECHRSIAERKAVEMEAIFASARKNRMDHD